MKEFKNFDEAKKMQNTQEQNRFQLVHMSQR